MLEDLTVKDFALIDSVSLDFSDGFTVLTGETGAGKSILIGSLTFLLGGKASADLIRTGSEEARVSGTLRVGASSVAARDWLHSRAIDPENGRVLLRRTLRTNGKSGSWIESVPVTRAELAEFTSLLVDIHGQHDHQSLLKVEEHRRFLDAYAGLLPEVRAFTSLYADLASKRRTRDEMNTSARERAEKAELLAFAIDEIEKAQLRVGEDDELASEEQRLSQHERLFSLIEQVTAVLSGPEGAVSQLKRARTALEASAAIDATLTAGLSRLESSYYELDDLSDVIASYSSSLAFDPARLETIEERLSVIFKLKKKYGATISDILSYAEGARAQLDGIEGWETNRAELDSAISALERSIYKAGTEISEKRAKAAIALQTGVEGILQSLGMAGTSFRVAIERREGSDTMQMSGPYGFDVIEFMISPNSGEPLRPLAKIASGGEISRVMLALKTMFASTDESETLIFDEIDTGIGGEVALAVGSHLQALSREKQVFCITHLASIAARADTQIKIEKDATDGKTHTSAYPVDGEGRVEEIARMLAGDGYSEASIQHARSLLGKFAG